MGGTTEYLDRECGLDTASALFQVSDVLLFSLADAAQRGAEANTDAILWLFTGVLDLRIIKRQLRRYDGELRVAVKSLQTLRRKKFFWIPIANLASATNTENTRIEACDAPNATPFRENSVLEMIDAGADACDRPDTGDDRASSAHAVTLSALASPSALMQCNVLLPTFWMKNSPMIGFKNGESRGRVKHHC